MECGVHQYVIDSNSHTKYETASFRFEWRTSNLKKYVEEKTWK